MYCIITDKQSNQIIVMKQAKMAFKSHIVRDKETPS